MLDSTYKETPNGQLLAVKISDLDEDERLAVRRYLVKSEGVLLSLSTWTNLNPTHIFCQAPGFNPESTVDGFRGYLDFSHRNAILFHGQFENPPQVLDILQTLVENFAGLETPANCLPDSLIQFLTNSGFDEDEFETFRTVILESVAHRGICEEDQVTARNLLSR